MKIVHGHALEFEAPNIGHRQRGKVDDKDNKKGETITFKMLMTGQEDTPENFSLQVAQQDEFYSPRHKHNFDQFRYALKGDFSIGKNVTLREGQLGYFPEGTPYGPQDDGSGLRQLLVLQFGAISGQGYMSREQLQKAAAELREHGHFEDGGFVREKGEGPAKQDGFEAVWEHHNGRKLEYARPRYRDPIVISPDAFGWLDADGEGKAKLKPLGTFTERLTRAEMLGLEAGGTYDFGPEQAIRLIYVTSGRGSIGGETWQAETAIQLEPGESASMAAEEPAEMLVMVLPLLSTLAGQGTRRAPQAEHA